MSDSILNTKNQREMYRVIFESAPCSRRTLADRLHLSLPTVTQELRKLTSCGLICADGTFASTGGRKAVMYRIVPEARLCAGLDITKRHVSMVVIGLDGHIIAAQRNRLAFSDDTAYYSAVSHMFETFVRDNRIPTEKLLGVGVSLPAIIGRDQKSITHASVIRITGDLYKQLCTVFSYPVLLFNDANAGGLAEAWHSETAAAGDDAGAPADNMSIYLSLSNSIGGATIYGRDIAIGDNCRASEFGHMTIIPNGRSCYCGQKGCLNAYCCATRLSDQTGGDLHQFFKQLPQNSALQAYFDRYLDHLALAVHNLRMCYDCHIILGGHVGAYMAEYIELLREKVARLDPFGSDTAYIHACHYQTEAAAAGAALHFVRRFVRDI